jgi:pimeloyl-ACP methyl ester carboxylesterase
VSSEQPDEAVDRPGLRDPVSRYPYVEEGQPFTVVHNRIHLSLWELRGGTAPRMLLLHGLGEQSPSAVPSFASGWNGSVHALDFTGHGTSTVPKGGGYTCEVLMGDVDVALARLGPCTIVGRGIGAYVALLIAGARPTLVRGAVLCDGPGLAGGGTGPGGVSVLHIDPVDAGPPDPWALLALTRDVRPPDYATSFARQAVQLSGLRTPIAVTARWRPPWLAAVAEEPGVVTATTIEEAVRAVTS